MPVLQTVLVSRLLLTQDLAPPAPPAWDVISQYFLECRMYRVSPGICHFAPDGGMARTQQVFTFTQDQMYCKQWSRRKSNTGVKCVQGSHVLLGKTGRPASDCDWAAADVRGKGQNPRGEKTPYDRKSAGINRHTDLGYLRETDLTRTLWTT